MTLTLRLAIALASLTVFSGCAGTLHDPASSTTTQAPPCQPITSTLTGAVILERGEHNVTTPGGSMHSSSYDEFPWQVPLGSRSRVEIVAEWQPGVGSETLQVHVGSSRVEDQIVARGGSPLNFTFTPTPELGQLWVFVRPSQESAAGIGVAVLPEPVEVQLTVRQTKLCLW